jgi:murein DD-endopeptidase MepM/ murein hydrolase activator NlpD
MHVEVTSERSARRDDALRRKRRHASAYRRRRICFGAGFTATCVIIVIAVLLLSASGTTAQVNNGRLMAGESPSGSVAVTGTGQARPAFARLDDRDILLPIASSDVTIIAYQPISDDRAVALTPIGEQVNSNGVVRFVRGIFSSEQNIRYYLIPGNGGSPTSSVLIGAAPGSLVKAPVSGVVTAVKQYKFYGKYDDVQIDIRPEATSGTTVSLMFIDHVAVSIGDVVSAGETQLGEVRECPKELGAVLSKYTHDSGSHVHMIVTQDPIG